MRPIDADALKARFIGGESMKSIAESVSDERFVLEIDAAPTIDLAERNNPKPLVPTESRESVQWGKCPECGKVNRVYYNFCANCGIPICPPKEDKPID